MADGARHCTGAVRPGDPAFKKLARRLTEKNLRPIFFVPDQGAEGGDMSAFQALANRVSGAVKSVPQNATSPDPYKEALHDVADQLSKEYVLRVRLPGSVKSPRVQVHVQRDHRWQQFAQLPAGEILALGLNPDTSDDCPEAFLVTTAGGAHMTEDCGAKWQAYPPPPGVTPATDAVVGEQTFVVGRDGTVHIWNSNIDEWEQLETAPSGVRRVAAFPGGHLWLVTREASAEHTLHYRAPEADEFVVVSTGQRLKHPPIILGPDDQDWCMLLDYQRQWCGPIDAQKKIATRRVQGLGHQALKSRVAVSPLPGRPGGFLLSAANKTLYRTIDGGSRWQEVLRGTPTAPVPVVWSERKPTPIGCTAMMGAPQCSNDLGRTWRPFGQVYGKAHASYPIGDHRKMFMASQSSYFQLRGLVNRDIPSSEVYFKTGRHEPASSINRFLRQIARAMEEDEEISLRVEGHADRRGDHKANQILSERRANAIRDFIASEGIDPDRIEAVGHGEDRPLRSGALARNRRVELLMTRPLREEAWVKIDECGRQVTTP